MIKKILIVILLCTSVSILAQRSNSSPYSFFGVGEEFSSRTVEQNAMGGLGAAYNHYNYLNFTNPASLAFLRNTVYSIGALNNDLTIKTTTANQSTTSTSLSYVALGFPIGQRAGFSAGLQPLSSVGYSLANNITDATGNIDEINLFEGNGGVNRIYASFGIKVWRDLAFGIEADYNFGNTENSITNQRENVVLATKYREVNQIRGGSVKLGMQYNQKLKNDIEVTAGATVKLANNLRVSGNDYLYSFSFSQVGEIPRDTISAGSINGSYTLPLKSTLGVGVGKTDKWFAGIEYEMQDALSTTGLLTTTNGAFRYGESSRFSLGGYYLPKINSLSSYWNRVTYRAGLRLEDTGLLVDGSGNNSNFTSIKDFGISFGLGLPLKRLSTVNVGFEFGQRGTTDNNLIEENYFNLRLSLSLTDSWFVKRKID